MQAFVHTFYFDNNVLNENDGEFLITFNVDGGRNRYMYIGITNNQLTPNKLVNLRKNDIRLIKNNIMQVKLSSTCVENVSLKGLNKFSHQTSDINFSRFQECNGFKFHVTLQDNKLLIKRTERPIYK